MHITNTAKYTHYDNVATSATYSSHFKFSKSVELKSGSGKGMGG